MNTDPENIVPTARNLPSLRTARAERSSSHFTWLYKLPLLGFHSCINEGLVIVKRAGLFKSPS